MKNSTKSQIRRIICAVLLSMIVPGASPNQTYAGNRTDPAGEFNTSRPKHGVYTVWTNGREYLSQQEFVTGGQVMFNWSQIETAKGQYNFQALEAAFAKYYERNQYATLQINGGAKPAWMYSEIPYYRARLHAQVNATEPGTLMFWHPKHMDAYDQLIQALSTFVQQNKYGACVLGIRMNYNSIGTEQLDQLAGKSFTDPLWELNGYDASELEQFSAEVKQRYKEHVIDEHVAQLSDYITILVRTSIGSDVITKYDAEFRSGKMGFFHTSSELEARNPAGYYIPFYDYAKPGYTIAYSEEWADPWGNRGVGVDARWCSPAQWVYWRTLSDLHHGVSCISYYASVMEMVVDGKHNGIADPVMQSEFRATIDLAAQYAGYSGNPHESPGAWIAMRESLVNRFNNTYITTAIGQGDYTFLMQRLDGDKSYGVHEAGITRDDGGRIVYVDPASEIRLVGPETQRYGAWARILPAGDTMRLAVNEAFLTTCQSVDVNVTYYDNIRGIFMVNVGHRRYPVKMLGTGEWKTYRANVKKIPTADKHGAHISISSKHQDLTLHMVEIKRR